MITTTRNFLHRLNQP